MVRAFVAGPIQGWERRQSYRKRLRKTLEAMGYEVVDPWEREKMIYSLPRRKGAVDPKVRDIIDGDLKDIEACDLLVAYLPRSSPGAFMELFYAKLKGKRTIVVIPHRDVSPWIAVHADTIVHGMRELERILSQKTQA